MALTPAQITDAIAVFDRGPWFRALPQAVKHALYARASIRRFSRGDVLVVEQLATEGLLGILDGEVAAYRNYGDGEEALILVVSAGTWLGVAGLLGPRAALTTVARTRGRAVFVSRASFEDLVREHPRFYRDVTALVIADLDAALSYLADTRDRRPEARVCSRIVEFAEFRARASAPRAGEALVLPLSQAELARMVGISRQTLNEILARLGRLGLLTASFRRIVIPDLEGLRAHALGPHAGPQARPISAPRG